MRDTGHALVKAVHVSRYVLGADIVNSKKEICKANPTTAH